MNEFYENSKRIINFIKDRSWLLTDSPYLSIESYIKYFEYGKESEFHIFPTMLPYKLSILDKYKNKIYNTSFLPNGPASLGMHTIVQISPKIHIVFVWGSSNDNKEAVVYPTIHSADSVEFINFLKDNEVLVYDDVQFGGFKGY